jgi:nucleoside phosphorylase
MKTDRNHVDILIVSAHLPELSGIRSMLGDRLEAEVGGASVAASAVGIGIAAAAAGTAFELDRRSPRAVVFLGTGGAYAGRNLTIGQVVVGRRIHMVSAAVASKAGAFPEVMPVVLEAAPNLRRSVSGGVLHEADIATTLAITTDDAVAANLSRSVEADVEHLEAFGVATACARRGVDLAVVLGVANVVGSQAREQWRAYHEAAGAGAGAAVVDWIGRGAPGLRTS